MRLPSNCQEMRHPTKSGYSRSHEWKHRILSFRQRMQMYARGIFGASPDPIPMFGGYNVKVKQCPIITYLFVLNIGFGQIHLRKQRL